MNCQWIKRSRFKKYTLPKKHQKSLTKRVRNWVEMRDSAFEINDVLAGLFLSDTEKPQLYICLYRICKEGLIKHRYFNDGSIMRGRYSKSIKPVKVFG